MSTVFQSQTLEALGIRFSEAGTKPPSPFAFLLFFCFIPYLSFFLPFFFLLPLSADPFPLLFILIYLAPAVYTLHNQIWKKARGKVSSSPRDTNVFSAPVCFVTQVKKEGWAGGISDAQIYYLEVLRPWKISLSLFSLFPCSAYLSEML